MKTWMFAALLACAAPALAQHEADVEAWRAKRLERLQSPTGWLSLVGLHWLEPGTHTIGKAAGNDIVLATGPQHLGTLVFAQGKVTLAPLPDAGVTMEGVATASPVSLVPDSAETPTTVVFDDGEASFQLIERSERFALRVRDARAPTRTKFAGIEHYPVDASWKFEATFQPHPPGKTLPIVNVLGMTEAMASPGVLSFVKDGKTYRLQAVDEGDGQYFLIFADRTNKNETYGAGRFVYAAPAVDGKTTLDFNKAYNPPCAFSAYSTCPLPPPENRLDLAVTAGEKRYLGPEH